MLTNQEAERVLDVVERAYRAIEALQRKRGPDPEYPDLLIIQLVVLKSLMGINSESSFLRQIVRMAIPRLGNLPERSRFNRRARSLQVQIALVQKMLAQRLDRGVTQKRVRIVDSKPIPVIEYSRAGRCKSFQKGELVNFGRNTITKRKFFGVRIHAKLNILGVVKQWLLKPANRHDVKVLPELIENDQNKDIVGDKGYLSEALKQDYQRQQNVTIVTPYKKNMKRTNTKREKRLLKFRKIVETIFSQFTDHFRIERTLAKSYPGLETRIAGIVLAHTVAVAYNYQYHRPLLAIKSILV